MFHKLVRICNIGLTGLIQIYTMSDPTPVSRFEDDIISLKKYSTENMEFFEHDTSETGKKLFKAFKSLLDTADPLTELVENVSSKFHLYDFDENVKANGYRSIVKQTEVLVAKTRKISEKISKSKSSYFFNKDYYQSEISAYSEAVRSLKVFLIYSISLMNWNHPGELYPMHNPQSISQIWETSDEPFNQYPFYGRCLGFQYFDSMAAIFKALCTLMAVISEAYYSGGILCQLLQGGKYVVNPELRARRVVHISQYASISFCKQFWLLGEQELMLRIQKLTGTPLSVDRKITIQPEPLSIKISNGELISIPIPDAHGDPAPYTAKLLSFTSRLGMIEAKKSKGSKFASDTLLFHCHGGGFVAQTSRSHESYLKEWAVDLDYPILTIDYSLAPEFPYPRALQEVFYAYCWAIKNAESLGWTGEKMIVIGDSAGGNMIIGLTLKCIEQGIKIPNGMCLAYVPVSLKLVATPSRMISLIDPVLLFGFCIGCFKAYVKPEMFEKSKENEYKLRRSEPNSPDKHAANVPEDVEPIPILMSQNETQLSLFSNILSKISRVFNRSVTPDYTPEEDSFLPIPLDQLDIQVQEDPYHSPIYAKDNILQKFPNTCIVSTEADPLLDECIEFAKRLKNLGVKVKLDVFPGLCHGFLNFSKVCPEAKEGSVKFTERIKELIAATEDT